MIRGIHETGEAMKPMMARLEVLANNLANINTTGFKRDSVFPEVLKEAAAGTGVPRMTSRELTDFSDGSLAQTGSNLDVAIQGDGFFVVQTPAGARYTRNGNFSLAADGTLTTSRGYAVAGTDGPIRFPDIQKVGKEGISVTETGEISCDGKTVGRFRVVRFDRLAGLTKDGTSMFAAPADEHPAEVPPDTVTIKQGYLEESNVEGIEEMIAMIEVMRAFESNQKAVQQQDASLERTLEVGRL